MTRAHVCLQMVRQGRIATPDGSDGTGDGQAHAFAVAIISSGEGDAAATDRVLAQVFVETGDLGPTFVGSFGVALTGGATAPVVSVRAKNPAPSAKDFTKVFFIGGLS